MKKRLKGYFSVFTFDNVSAELANTLHTQQKEMRTEGDLSTLEICIQNWGTRSGRMIKNNFKESCRGRRLNRRNRIPEVVTLFFPLLYR